MPGLGWLIHSIDILAAIVGRLGEARRARRAFVVAFRGGRCLVRAGTAGDAPLVASAEAGAALPEEIFRRGRGELVLLEWPLERTVIRKITLPAKAREFTAGVIRNQIERLSPWPVTQILYGFVAEPGSGADGLDVRVLIAERSEIESALASLSGGGLTADRVVVEQRKSAGEAPVVLWSRNAQQAHQKRRRLCFVIGGGLAAYASLCAAVSLWALNAAASLEAESEDLVARLRNVQKSAQVAKSPQAIAALSPPERAWVSKETSISTVFLFESLTRALPDGAYVTELQFESDKLRVTGVADDAPPLIGALETSGQLLDAHFVAPTTRGPDGKLFRFSIEANVTPRLVLEGE